MHPNRNFRNIEIEKKYQLLIEKVFGSLIFAHSEGVLVSHVPFLLDESCEFLEMHLVRSNPILRHLDTPKDVVFTVHGPDEFYHVGEQQLEKKFAAAKFIICISDFAKSQVMKYTAFTEWDKLHINYLGVDTTQFSPSPQAHNNEIPVLLCVGRLVNAKGQGVLLQAAKTLIDRGVNFTLQIVGDGPDKIDLEKFSATHQLTQHVNFMGKVNHDQIQQLQQKADVFVLPSFAEGIPIVLMEAMACGTPCVTTHITGIPELFTHDHDGLLVRPGNAIMLADALERLITQTDTRDRLKTAALATVRDQWCIHQSNQRLAQLFIQRLS